MLVFDHRSMLAHVLVASIMQEGRDWIQAGCLSLSDFLQ
jgi:hypothetical protein